MLMVKENGTKVKSFWTRQTLDELLYCVIFHHCRKNKRENKVTTSNEQHNKSCCTACSV